MGGGLNWGTLVQILSPYFGLDLKMFVHTPDDVNDDDDDDDDDERKKKKTMQRNDKAQM